MDYVLTTSFVSPYGISLTQREGIIVFLRGYFGTVDVPESTTYNPDSLF